MLTSYSLIVVTFPVIQTDKIKQSLSAYLAALIIIILVGYMYHIKWLKCIPN